MPILQLLGVLLTVLMIGCQSQDDTPVTTAPAVTTETAEQQVEPNTLTAEERRQRREQRAAERAARRAERRAERLASLTDEERAAREQLRQERLQNRQANLTAQDTDSASEILDQAQRRERQFVARIQQKSWWNTRNGQLGELSLEESQITSFDTAVSTLMEIRKTLAPELESLWQSNREALASGDTRLIASNLERIDTLEAQWNEAKRNTTLEIIDSLDSEQLAVLSDAGGDIVTMDWLNIDLGRGVSKPLSSQQEQKRQRREQRRNSHNQ